MPEVTNRHTVEHRFARICSTQFRSGRCARTMIKTSKSVARRTTRTDRHAWRIGTPAEACMEKGTDAETVSFSTEQFPVVMRGYDRTAVEEALRQEQERHGHLAERMETLQRELDALSTSAGIPSRKRVLRRALDLLADGWDDAVRITAETEYQLGRARAHAEGVAAAQLEITEQQCALAERNAQDEADRMVAAARDEASRILAEAQAKLETAKAAAVELIRIATERAAAVTYEFDEAFRTLAGEAEVELKERQAKADFDLETAAAQTESAKADADAILERAEKHRAAMLEGARAQVAAIEASSDSEAIRLQEETDRAVAELADLMLSAGGQLSGAKPNPLSVAPDPDTPNKDKPAA